MFSDPPGAKIGCGGATMYVLEELEANIPREELEKGRLCAYILQDLKNITNVKGCRDGMPKSTGTRWG